MRRRNVRMFFFIGLLVVTSALIISYQDIDLPGDSLDRGGTGPLGLVLGLDLRGGTHLVYEAQSPAKIDVTFGESISEDELDKGLKEMGFAISNISGFSKDEFSIDVPNLSPGRMRQFVQDLEGDLGSISKSSEERDERIRARLTIKDAPNEATVTEIFKGLGYSDAMVTSLTSQVFTVDDLPSLNEEAVSDLEVALDRLFPVEEVRVFPLDDDDKSQGVVGFKRSTDQGAILSLLSDLKFEKPMVSTQDGKNFSAIVEAAGSPFPSVGLNLAELEKELPDSLVGVEEFSTSIIDVAVIQIAFEEGINQIDLETAFTDLGFREALITQTKGRNYAVALPSVTDEQQLTLQSDMTKKLASVELFALNRDAPTEERMDGVVDTIQRRVNAFGITEPVVQRMGTDRVIVQLPGVEDTNIDVTFRESVAQDDLKDGLNDLGFSNATINRKQGEPISNSVDIIIQGLTEEAQADIRKGLEVAFGDLESYSFNQPSGRVRVAFQKLIGADEVRSVVNDLGFPNPIIGQSLGSSFRIRTPTLTTEEQNTLGGSLNASIGPTANFVISGGVEEAKGLIGQTARLEFKERTCLSGDFNTVCREFEDNEAVGRSGESLTGANLDSSFSGTHPTTGLPVVNFVFDGTGTRIFRDLTTRISGDTTKCVATVLDDENIICPSVDRPIIGGSGFIEGPDFTFDKVRTLSIQFESGSLPVSLEVVRESTVDSILGDESLKASLKAGFIGLGLIVLFMVAYYRLPGLVAACSLVIYAVIILAVFKMVPVILTLSGMAGLILSIGMAVDANILVFERLKEELRSGRSLLSAIDIAFRRAWPAIRDSNVSTFITCGILFYFGRELGEPRITGFAVTLAIGVALSMFSVLFISRNFMQLLVFSPLGRKIDLFSPEGARRPIDGSGVEK